MYPRLALILPALGLSLPILLTAQQPPPVTPGQQVRVTASALGMNRRTGRLKEVRGDTLLVTSWEGLLGLIVPPRRIPVHLIDTLEVSQNHGAPMPRSSGERWLAASWEGLWASWRALRVELAMTDWAARRSRSLWEASARAWVAAWDF